MVATNRKYFYFCIAYRLLRSHVDDLRFSMVVDRFLQSFHHMKALWVQMIDLYLVFRYVKGRCYGNQLILGKCHEHRLIPLAFLALSLENELQYHCLNVRINSSNNQATPDINLVGF